MNQDKVKVTFARRLLEEQHVLFCSSSAADFSPDRGRERRKRNSAEKVNFSRTSSSHLTYLGSPEEVHHCGWWHVLFSFAPHSNQIKQYTRPAIFLLQENASIDLLQEHIDDTTYYV